MDKKGKTYKRIYFAVVAALFIVSGGAVVSNFNTDKITDVPEETTVIESAFEDEEETLPAQLPKNDVPDDRIYNNTEDEETETENTSVYEEKTKPFETESLSEITTEESTVTEQITKECLMPLSGEIIKGCSFDVPLYNSTMGDWRVHTGIDVAGEEGEEVTASTDGIVTKVYVDSKWGYVIEIDHGEFTGRYMGISQENAIGINDTVKSGETIGTLTTIPCESADGIHLHFEVVKEGKNINPTEVF